MDKNTLYPLASLVLVILVAGAIYVLAGMFGGTQPHDGGHEGEHGEALPEELFFEAIRNPLQYSEYTYAYEEVSSNGYASSVFLTASENYSYVRKEDAIFTRELIISENATILCLENVNRRLCSEVAQNSSFKPYSYTLESLLFDHETIERTEEVNELLLHYGAIVFGDDVSETSYDGRGCSEISYTLDYGKLTVEQMWQVGMSPDSPEVLVSKEFNFTLCIDPESGDVIHKFLSYHVFGEPYSTESTTTQIMWGASSEIKFPTEFDSEAEMDSFLSALRMSQENYYGCLMQEDADTCIRGEAILSRNERLCELILNSTSRDICYVNVGLEKGDPSLCNETGGENRDACFMEFAWKYNNASYCGDVSDESREECMDLITEGMAGESGEIPPSEESGEPEAPAEEGNGSAEGTSPGQGETQYGSECVSDSDCVVVGCSSQLCVPSCWSDVATTCEYREEYNCLPLTSCGCSNGFCSWAETEEYSKCMGQIG